MWQKMDHIESKALKQTASSLPNLFQAVYADTSNSKYERAWNKWRSWTNQYPEVLHCPADPFFVACYFNDLILHKEKLTIVLSAFNAIKWGHTKSGEISPTDHPFVKTAFEGAKRLAVPSIKNKKEPVTSDMLRQFTSHYGYSNNFCHLRFLILALLGFAGFFRISELLVVKIKHVKFSSSHAEIFVEKSKTDQLREGNIVYICKSGGQCCPVTWLTRYLNTTGLKSQPEAFLLCRLYKTKKGHNVHGNKGLSYTRAREMFIEHIDLLYKEVKGKFGLHSLRSGGASAAANADVNERLIGKHGRWAPKSTSMGTYIKDSKQKRLSVTSSLNL